MTPSAFVCAGRSFLLRFDFSLYTDVRMIYFDIEQYDECLALSEHLSDEGASRAFGGAES